MIGSLISAQLCPRNATDQQTDCQQAQSSFEESVVRCFFDGGVHLVCEHMSSLQVKRGEVLHSEATDASADGGLGCVQSYSTWRREQLLASENVCETKQR